ncbi:hypothetical protein HZA55_05155 [Candidatus Poribacteria bacterium]|nr:hypothetical protein [Candidatus Poribacteria bacterium]
MAKKDASHNQEEQHSEHGSNSGHGHGSSPKSNPLEKIKEKELELRGKHLETKKQAEVIVAEARKKASDIRRSATEKASKEAQIYFDKEVAKIRSETVKFGEEEVINANKLAEKNFNNAKDFVLKAIVSE